MKVTITFRHMEATDAIRNHVDTQLGRLEKYLIKPIEIHVILSVEKFRHRAEVVAFEQHFKAQADEVSDDLYISIDHAIEKVETQIKKHKEKLQEHHKHHTSVGDMASLAEKEYRAALNRES
jgi:putative sigma-54 modulation protein